jgi:hypothetical protein
MTDARRTTVERRDWGPARSPDAAPGLMQVWLLGRFEVRVGSLTIGEGGWRLRKAASLVKLLALAPGHRRHCEQILDLLWLDLKPGPAANNFHQTLPSFSG